MLTLSPHKKNKEVIAKKNSKKDKNSSLVILDKFRKMARDLEILVQLVTEHGYLSAQNLNIPLPLLHSERPKLILSAIGLSTLFLHDMAQIVIIGVII